MLHLAPTGTTPQAKSSDQYICWCCRDCTNKLLHPLYPWVLKCLRIDDLHFFDALAMIPYAQKAEAWLGRWCRMKRTSLQRFVLLSAYSDLPRAMILWAFNFCENAHVQRICYIIYLNEIILKNKGQHCRSVWYIPQDWYVKLFVVVPLELVQSEARSTWATQHAIECVACRAFLFQ